MNRSNKWELAQQIVDVLHGKSVSNARDALNAVSSMIEKQAANTLINKDHDIGWSIEMLGVKRRLMHGEFE